MNVLRTQRLAGTLGVLGGLLGVLAGLTQALIGDRIGAWAGEKSEPLGLGLLTMMLGVVAVLSATALSSRGGEPVAASPRRRAAVLAGMGVPALLCFSTVGPLWYVPGIVLLAAVWAVAVAGNGHDLLATVRAEWLRVLLTALGSFVLLMALGATPVTIVFGVAGGLLVMLSAWLPVARPVRLLLIAVGTVPFAVLTWWSVVTPLVALVALAVGLAITTEVGTGSRPEREVLRNQRQDHTDETCSAII